MVVLGTGAGVSAAAPARPAVQGVENCTEFEAGSVCFKAGQRAGTLYLIWLNSADEQVGDGSITTYSNSRTKHLVVCDTRGDNMSPAIQIDPLGAGPPDTLLYFDENGSQPGCNNRSFGYNVRKWSMNFEQGGQPVFPPDWTLAPFPPCPPCDPQ